MKTQSRINLRMSSAIIVLFTSMLMLCLSTPTLADQCYFTPRIPTEIPFIIPFAPETNVSYWMYSFDKTNAEDTVFMFKGEFPFARHMSYMLVDGDKNNRVAQGLSDCDIIPLKENFNPYEVRMDRDWKPREYRIWLVPELDRQNIEQQIMQAFPDEEKPNIITIPFQITNPRLTYRIYLPDSDQDKMGGVSVPEIFAFEAIDIQTPKSCPGWYFYSAEEETSDEIEAGEQIAEKSLIDDKIRSFRLESDGPNVNTYYLGSLFKNRFLQQEVVIFEFFVPTFPKTYNEDAPLSGEEQVRYWSICLQGLEYWQTSKCLFDESAILEDAGGGLKKVKIVVGSAAIDGIAPLYGFNHFKWGFQKPWLFFRQVHPQDFPGAYNKIDEIFSLKEIAKSDEELSDLLAKYEAEGKLPAGWAPVGRYCSLESFIENGGDCQ